MYPELNEAERFPLLSQRGRQLLQAMRQHAAAPVWNWPNGEQLDERGLARVNQFGSQLQSPILSNGLAEPVWLEEFKERCLEFVPYYRQRSRPGTSFLDLPTCKRSDLAPRVWQFVPDDEPLDQLITFSSSGTTGHPTRTPHHPFSAACGIPLIEHALQSMHGIEIPKGVENMAITNVAAYPGAYTTAIVVAYLREAGCIRVNLDPSAWRDQEHCQRYLNAWRGKIWLGDPVAFGELEKIDLDYQPQAIVSSIMHLNEGYAQRLSERYNCPVLDMYAMTEAGIIAAREANGHRVLPHDLFVEVLDESGNRCEQGQRGEITLSGGRNPFLPLLRYRTGDYAALRWIDGHRVLVDLVGREPVEYISDSGIVVHSMEIVRVMRQFPVRRYELQPVAGGYQLSLEGDFDRRALVAKLRQLLGSRLIESGV